jgi:hypothetical protein
MRKHNSRRPRLEKVSEHARYLTPSEVLAACLSLAQTMVGLILSEDEGPVLPPALQEALAGLAVRLEAVLQEARRLP